MKKYFIISVLFVLISTASSAQLRGIGDTTDIWHFARFEETPLYISIPDQTDNIWQIGPPQKEFFDQAYSQPNAIVTDTIQTYPTNNHSYFQLTVSSDYIYIFPYNIFVDFTHKINTDEGLDGGYITASWDNGGTWVNAINDSVYLGQTYPFFNEDHMYTNEDTLANGEPGFSGSSNEWVTSTLNWYVMPVRTFHPDTLLLRFHFFSDNNENQLDGWMIDDIKVYSIDVGGSNKGLMRDNSIMKIAPNPLSEASVIKLDQTYQRSHLIIYNSKGIPVKEETFSFLKEIPLGQIKLKPGVYIVKMVVDDNTEAIRKVIVNK